MQLTVWTYEGPPHVGAMRIATAMDGLHYVLHAPQGDTYADLLFTMIERRDKRPPVTYTTFQARDLGGDTAELFKNAVREADVQIFAIGIYESMGGRGRRSRARTKLRERSEERSNLGGQFAARRHRAGRSRRPHRRDARHHR